MGIHHCDNSGTIAETPKVHAGEKMEVVLKGVARRGRP
jgi:hypothetical protein